MGAKQNRLINEIRKFKEIVSSEHGVEKMILFGSRAHGRQHKYSDVDLIVVSKSFKGVRKLKRSPALYIRWNLDYPVDFICYTPEEFNKLKKQITIVKEAVENGIEIK